MGGRVWRLGFLNTGGGEGWRFRFLRVGEGEGSGPGLLGVKETGPLGVLWRARTEVPDSWVLAGVEFQCIGGPGI